MPDTSRSEPCAPASPVATPQVTGEFALVLPRGRAWVFACACGFRIQHKRRRLVALLGAEHDHGSSEGADRG